jgi:hypothetical protein
MASAFAVKATLIELSAFGAIADSGDYQGVFGELREVIRYMQVAGERPLLSQSANRET